MKWFFIFVVINLTNPEDKPQMGHKAYSSYEQCVTEGNKLPEPPPNLKVVKFCVSEDDLLELNHV